MLPTFLSKLFTSRNPDELMRERMDTWHMWLQPLPSGAEQSNASGIGRDPAYEDAFFTIKDEVSKLSNVDDSLIASSCEQLLKEVGKDLRLAADYTFARLKLDGSTGFADGIELTAALVDRFGDALHPSRAEARKGALEWLSNTRLLDQLSRFEDFSPIDLERAIGSLHLLETHTALWPEGARPNLQPLISRFEQRDNTSQSLLGRAIAEIPIDSGVSDNSLPVAAVASTRDVLEQARVMAQFLRNQERGYLSSTRLIRCVRWDTVHDLPPSDQQGRTRLVPPRTELRQQFKRLVLQKQWHELLERVEGAYTEGANHLWLDLQYFQHSALEQVGSPYTEWSDLLRSDFALMLERLDGIERLAFNEGTPFADDVTLDWIARHAVVRDLEAGEAMAPLALSGESTATDAAHWQELEAQVRELQSSDGLEAAFGWLQGLPGMQSERQQFLQRWLMARLADHAGKLDTALHLLTELNSLTQHYQLNRWEPTLVFEVKHHLHRLLKQSGQRKDADKADVTRRAEQLQAELTVLNPVQALGIF
ncbi:type VI secretion system protein TssA [Glaciimonas sp. PAMC28666]|uniref:type VI secretion system protein TssA n=1 Tax=Glaciimonas sp. PAMC28666 TaxID=2807626 RepID=UPI0019652DEC|nr:type VI secretion system protein TssA [Glaciimonas sp. PAMC28666]QRX83111.1 type VI secretion system protein TssA [Glaciimonas sp. PAMC28666]